MSFQINKNSGFSLIELMIVIAIVGILASIAVPSYQNYIRGANMAKVMSLADMFKQKAILYRTKNGVWPANNTAVGLPDSRTYATDVIEKAYTVVKDGNGLVIVHIKEEKFGVSGTAYVRLYLVEENGIVKTDCSSRGGTFPTSESLLPYVDC